MLPVTIRFHGNLNGLLFRSFAGPIVKRQLTTPTSVKDLIEGCGVPHNVADLLLVNSKPVDFSFLVQEDQSISVFPFFSHINIPEGKQLQKPSLPHNRFLVDANLGKLARYLRIGGFDTVYIREQSDKEIISQMLDRKRVLLSRDRKLLMHKVVEYGYLPRSDDPVDQFREVCRRFDLADHIDPFSRCPNCNGKLQSVSKEDVIDQLESLTKKHFEDFSQCGDCGQVYWTGSHRKRMDERVKKILVIAD